MADSQRRPSTEKPCPFFRFVRRRGLVRSKEVLNNDVHEVSVGLKIIARRRGCQRTGFTRQDRQAELFYVATKNVRYGTHYSRKEEFRLSGWHYCTVCFGLEDYY